ncbi:hypothetical protein JKP75_01800 [Blastococcus sp. TML/M2B]|nr:hypothetical protein [Blastococcus sp. TML/M2B]MBN1091430.1 hypothetical protein [Blastococcus sp. TML/M2B]
MSSRGSSPDQTASSVRVASPRHPAGLGAHDDPLDEHLRGELLGQLGAQPAHVGAQLVQLAQLLPQGAERGEVVAHRGHPGDLVAQPGQPSGLGAQRGHAGHLLAQPGEGGQLGAERVELRAHGLLALPAELGLQLQLVLAARGDLEVQLVLVGPAQLPLAGRGGRPVARAAAGGEGRQDERPGHGDDGDPEVLGVVGEEDRERGTDRQQEARADDEGAPAEAVRAPGCGVVVQGAGHAPRVAAQHLAVRLPAAGGLPPSRPPATVAR